MLLKILLTHNSIFNILFRIEIISVGQFFFQFSSIIHRPVKIKIFFFNSLAMQLDSQKLLLKICYT